jgi:hypothetical protein
MNTFISHHSHVPNEVPEVSISKHEGYAPFMVLELQFKGTRFQAFLHPKDLSLDALGVLIVDALSNVKVTAAEPLPGDAS